MQIEIDPITDKPPAPYLRWCENAINSRLIIAGFDMARPIVRKPNPHSRKIIFYQKTKGEYLCAQCGEFTEKEPKPWPTAASPLACEDCVDIMRSVEGLIWQPRPLSEKLER